MLVQCQHPERMSSRRKQVTWIEDPKSGCWNCTSHSPNTHGYPMLWKDGIGQHMHRVLYEEKFGDLGALVARHTCDNPLCINLTHIIPGTWADNNRDMSDRNRRNTARGDMRSDTRIPDVDIDAIRNSTDSQYALAAKYGVSQSTISRIQAGLRRKFS